MTKVLIKHKDGSTSGPYEMKDDFLYVHQMPYHKSVYTALGLEVIPYEERKVEITRQMLAEAWDKYTDGHIFMKNYKSGIFKNICKELGLE